MNIPKKNWKSSYMNSEKSMNLFETEKAYVIIYWTMFFTNCDRIKVLVGNEPAMHPYICPNNFWYNISFEICANFYSVSYFKLNFFVKLDLTNEN